MVSFRKNTFNKPTKPKNRVYVITINSSQSAKSIEPIEPSERIVELDYEEINENKEINISFKLKPNT